MGKRNKPHREKPKEERPSSANSIKVWRPDHRTQIASSVARQMQAQGVPLPPNADIVQKGVIPGSMVPADVSLSRWRGLYPEHPAAVQARMKMREGKKTWVCMGTSPDSC